MVIDMITSKGVKDRPYNCPGACLYNSQRLRIFNMISHL